MRIEVDPNPPTVQSFLYALHYSNENAEISLQRQIARVDRLEAEHSIRLPAILRTIYQQQNGGHTHFQIVPAVESPSFIFEGPDPCSAFQQSWRDAFIDNDLYPLELIKTLGWYSDQIEFGDESLSWRNFIDDADRLLVLNAYGSEVYLCLDFREDHEEPKVVLLNQGYGPERLEIGFVYEDFEAFFKATRRVLE